MKMVSRCSLCFQPISHSMEIKYHLCSHCVHNFHQRPEDMSLEKWVSQFELKKINNQLTLQKMQ